MITQKLYGECDPCGRKREVWNPIEGEGLCPSCGHPLQVGAKVHPERRRDTRPHKSPCPCPRCKSTACHTMEAGRFLCARCSAVFEEPDFDFVDDRPDVNAEKMEGR